MTIRLLFLPLVLVIAFFSIIYFDRPLWKENGLLKKEVNSLTINLAEIKGKSNFTQKVIGEYQQLGNEKDLIKNALPEEKEGNILLAEFFEKAKKSGAFLKSIKIGQGESVDLDFLKTEKAVEKEGNEKKDVIASAFESEQQSESSYGLKKAENSMELFGSYEEVRNFILEVEKMNRFLNIVSVELKKIEDNNKNETVQEDGAPAPQDKKLIDVSLGVNTYWIKSREEEMKEKIKEGTAEAKSISANDLIVKSILGGKFSFEVINDFQNSITKEIFYFGNDGGQTGLGKSSLF